MLASRRWRDWKPPAIFQECPESELTKPTKPNSVSSVSTIEGHSQKITASEQACSYLPESVDPYAPLPPVPEQDPADWREAFVRWINSDCIAHWRLHGGIGRLHVAFSEWEIGQGEVPCSRAVFERLLREQSWEIEQPLALVSGLMLRKDIDGSGYFPELLSR